MIGRRRPGTVRAPLVVPMLLTVAALVLPGPSTAVAQTVRGTAVDAASGAPVDGATVVMVDSAGADRAVAVADAAGEFWLEAPEPGRYRLRAERLGYAETLSAPVDLVAGEVVTVVLRMSTDPIALEALTVTARRDARLERWDYYERRELYGEKMGFAHFLDRAEIERRNPLRVSDLLRQVPGVRVRSAGGRRVVVRTRRPSMLGGAYSCDPFVYLDGVRIATGSTIDEIASVVDLIAVEVYPGRVAPAQYSDGRCGAIVLWTGYVQEER